MFNTFKLDKSLTKTFSTLQDMCRKWVSTIYDKTSKKSSLFLSNNLEHLLYEQNDTVKSYSGAETLETRIQDGMTIARFNWKQYAGSISITGLDKRNNQGEAAMIRLLTAKTSQTEMSLRDRMSVDAYGDGTGNASKNLTGLAALVSSTSTVGGLSPTTFTWWQGDVTTSAGSFAATGVDKMRTTFNNITFGNDKPDFIVTDQTTHEFYEKALQPQERYVNTKAADAGFINLTFKGVPVFFDRDCTTGFMYMLNSKYLNLVVHKDADFDTGPFVTPMRKLLGLFKGFARRMFDALTFGGVGNSYVACPSAI